MGKETAIAWTDHTFSIVWGCSKVSEGCKFCYADAFSTRVGHGKRLPTIWGVSAERRTFGEKHWREPLKWNAAAAKAGIRKRVFCSSMADVFEDHPTVAEERKKLWPLIEQTPWLDWQLLTKRPENMVKFAPESWRPFWPGNVWAGTTAENQARAEERIPTLLAVPAAVKFVSYEPALGPVDFTIIHTGDYGTGAGCYEMNAFTGQQRYSSDSPREYNTPSITGRLSWVIVGGESGSHARPFDLGWARSVVAQCKAAGVPVFMKQMGEDPVDGRDSLEFSNRKGDNPEEWPPELRVQEFPKP